ncbi:class I adenylate-forming enzyme family protein [Paenibacillus sanguinis]|uniref:class I adenylate-forming enzyme family protein n=1 Tax=Paenibacillus sanguinis TaxID=225906 RepID=UPI0003671180|nr:AMP-binding protein [Paenibacillus sanguinis]
MNLLLPILNHAIKEPDQTAISHARGSLTYSELVERVQKVACGLRKMAGFGTRDKVAILSQNRAEFVEVFLGTLYAGGVPVVLDPKWSACEVAAVIRQCSPKVLVHDQDLTGIAAGEDDGCERFAFSGDGQPPGSYDMWLAAQEPRLVMEAAHELLFIGFTSGTTGMPKGYARTPSSWLRSFEATGQAFELGHMKQVMAPGPLAHSISLFALMQCLVGGGTFHMQTRFAATDVLKLCASIPGMILYVVPTMIDALLEAADGGQYFIGALISSGGLWSERSKKRCRERFAGTRLYEYYGSSEASYISYADASQEQQPGCLGKPFKGVEVSIRDEHFRELSPGAAGLLYVRSPMLFAGYYGLAEETQAVFRDGWLRTGDYVHMDDHGTLYLAGRLQNMIKTGGLKVFPEEVEQVLRRIPSIREVMVFGKPDEHWGEQVTAIIQWRKGLRWSLEDIKAYCLQRLASYKIPKELIAVNRFSYTSSGKIARRQMIEVMKGDSSL